MLNSKMQLALLKDNHPSLNMFDLPYTYYPPPEMFAHLTSCSFEKWFTCLQELLMYQLISKNQQLHPKLKSLAFRKKT